MPEPAPKIMPSRHYVWIAGGRDFANLDLVDRWLTSNYAGHEIICHGGARGVDMRADRVAREIGAIIVLAPAYSELWDMYPGMAGHMRNAVLCDMADELVAFWDGRSGGTKNAVELAQRKGIKVTWVHPDGSVDIQDPRRQPASVEW